MLDSIEAAAAIGTWQYAFSSDRLTWSNGLYKLLGIEAHAPPSRDLFDGFAHPADRLSIDDMSSYLQKVRSIDRDFRIIRPGGTTRWVNHKAEVICNDRGECAFASGLLADITDRCEALNARDFAEARLRSVTGTARSFTWTVSASGQKPPSAGWMRLTGQSAAESSRSGWLDAVDKRDRSRVKKAWDKAMEQQTPYAAKYRLRCRDGVTRWFVARCTPLFNEAHEIVEWFGVGMDISDVKGPSESLYSADELQYIGGDFWRAARAMLDWSIEEFAAESGLSASSIRRLEGGDDTSVRSTTALKAIKTFAARGLQFHRFDDERLFISYRFCEPG